MTISILSNFTSKLESQPLNKSYVLKHSYSITNESQMLYLREPLFTLH